MFFPGLFVLVLFALCLLREEYGSHWLMTILINCYRFIVRDEY